MARRPWSVMANNSRVRKVAKATFPGMRVAYIRRGDRFAPVLSRALTRAVLLINSDVVNYHSCELFLDCDIYMYHIMELMMHLISRWIS